MQKSYYEQVIEKNEIIETLRKIIGENETELAKIKKQKEELIEYLKTALDNGYLPIGLYANIMTILGVDLNE